MPDDAPESVYSHHRRPWELAESTPLSVWAASFFVSVVTLIQLGIAVAQLFGGVNVAEMKEVTQVLSEGDLSAENFQALSSIIYVAALGIFALVETVLALNVIRGRQRSRKMLLAILCIAFLMTAIDTITGSVLGNSLYAVFILMGSHVFAMIEYTSDGAVNYTHNSTEMRLQGRRRAES